MSCTTIIIQDRIECLLGLLVAFYRIYFGSYDLLLEVIVNLYRRGKLSRKLIRAILNSLRLKGIPIPTKYDKI